MVFNHITLNMLFLSILVLDNYFLDFRTLCALEDGDMLFCETRICIGSKLHVMKLLGLRLGLVRFEDDKIMIAKQHINFLLDVG